MADPYIQAKLLLSADKDTDAKRMQKLLGTASVDPNTKPSKVLQNLQNLVGTEINNEIFKEIGLSKIDLVRRPTT